MSQAGENKSSESSNGNLLIGADFAQNPWNRGTSFTSATRLTNNNGIYLADRWLLLSDGNNVVNIARTATRGYGATVVTATKKFGMCQILLAEDSFVAIGTSVSVGLRGVSGTGITKMRIAVISWDGTRNTTTLPVSTWGSAGTNPTLTAGWTYENTPTDITISSSSSNYFVNNILIDTANTKQFALLIWCDDTAELGAGDVFQINGAAMTIGDSFRGFPIEDFAENLKQCACYYNKSNPIELYPTNTGITGVVQTSKVASNTTYIDMNYYFSAPMWKIPSTLLWPSTSGTAGFIRNLTGAVDVLAVVSQKSNTNCVVEISAATVTENMYSAHVAVQAELGV